MVTKYDSSPNGLILGNPSESRNYSVDELLAILSKESVDKFSALNEEI